MIILRVELSRFLAKYLQAINAWRMMKNWRFAHAFSRLLSLPVTTSTQR